MATTTAPTFRPAHTLKGGDVIVTADGPREVFDVRAVNHRDVDVRVLVGNSLHAFVCSAEHEIECVR